MEKNGKSVDFKDFKDFEHPPQDTITLIKQKDGNWKGFALKNGQIISERQYDPQIVLQLLLTHE